jgi:hypothetical protein
LNRSSAAGPSLAVLAVGRVPLAQSAGDAVLAAGLPARVPPVVPRRPPPSLLPTGCTCRSPTGKTRLSLSGSLFLYAPKISSWFPCIIGLQQELRSPTTHPSSGACHGLPRPAADCSHVGCERANIRSRASPSRPSLFSPSPASTLIRKSYS